MAQVESLEEKLRQVFCDVFNLKPEEVYDNLTPSNVPNWDSMQHLNLIVSIEERFGVSFSPEEIGEIGDGGFRAARKILVSKGVAG